jgi:hypothetical protein
MQPILVPFIAIAVTLGFLVYRRAAVGNMEQQYAAYRAGSLAQRLGMTLVEGDPGFNLFIRQANVDVRRGPGDGRPIQVQVRMQGTTQGVPLQLVYLYRVEQHSDIAQVTWRTWFDCRMIAQTRRPFPPFEVISRTAPLGPIAATQPLPQAPTGNSMVDSTYAVATAEPALARLLGEMLGGFATFQNSGVHLVGDGSSISFVMKQDKAPLLANALYYAELMAQQLAALAQRVGG